MHRKKVFFLAAIFLSVALAVPPIFFITLASSELNAYIEEQRNPSGHLTGNVTFIEQISQTRQTVYLIIIAIEAVFIVLFAVTAWIGISHYHGELDKPKPASFDDSSK